MSNDSTCQWEPQIVALLGNDLNGLASTAIRTHLQQCVSCKHAYEEALRGCKALSHLAGTGIPNNKMRQWIDMAIAEEFAQARQPNSQRKAVMFALRPKRKHEWEFEDILNYYKASDYDMELQFVDSTKQVVSVRLGDPSNPNLEFQPREWSMAAGNADSTDTINARVPLPEGDADFLVIGQNESGGYFLKGPVPAEGWIVIRLTSKSTHDTQR